MSKPDLAALLHPWTCKPNRMDAQPEHTDGGWLCQRAAADIAFRLGNPDEYQRGYNAGVEAGLRAGVEALTEKVDREFR